MSKSKAKSNGKQKDADRVKALEDRKARDAKFNYKYSPCPYCGEATRYKGASLAPATCGKEGCTEKMFKDQMKKKRNKKSE